MPLTSNNKPKPAVSTLSTDLTIVGNLRTTGDIQVEGHVQGDIRAHLLTVGEGATIEGEIVADDVVVNGRVIGRVRGLKVRLTATAKVEGDIVHKTIAIESGAHFEGSVQRQEDPLARRIAPRRCGGWRQCRPAGWPGSGQQARLRRAAEQARRRQQLGGPRYCGTDTPGLNRRGFFLARQSGRVAQGPPVDMP